VSLENAERAIGAFVDAIHEAEAMAASGHAGDDFDDILRHAHELLDIIDEEMAVLDPIEHDRNAAKPAVRYGLFNSRSRPLLVIRSIG